MTTIYLYLNAAIYVLFSIWCTVAASSTAQAMGFIGLSRAGAAEYLTVYGGLQLGLGIIFGWTAWSGELRFGLIVALALYVPIVLWRIAGVSMNWPVANNSLYIAGLELAMLVAAVLLWLTGFRSR
ncbi:MAG: DUF4345 domain-containing protein [Dokdonella sp.]